MEHLSSILYGCVGLFLLYRLIAGWRLGPVRQLVRMGALVAGVLAALSFGKAILPLLRFSGYPDVLLEPVAATLVGLAVYATVRAIGGSLFRSTSDQPYGIVWLIYGFSGALIGGTIGVLFLALVAVGVRYVGTFVEGMTTSPSAPATQGEAADSPWVTAKRTLEAGWRGTLLDLVDPLPESAYHTAKKMGRLAASPQLITRLAEYPQAAPLFQNPEIVRLQGETRLQEALRNGDYLTLLKDPKLQEAANHPKVAALIRNLQLGPTLDFLLKQAGGPATPLALPDNGTAANAPAAAAEPPPVHGEQGAASTIPTTP
ncbi:MAG TPA: CvpA family protein [Chthoniobacteraceae bacterium]|nr:CvpA family protein [Chthoniobacteraceae bacterium]